MNVELGKLPDGNLVVVADSAFRKDVVRVEYYRDQRLMMLVYDDPDHEGDLMDHELTEDAARHAEGSPSVLIVTAEPGKELLGYPVPLVQVGDIY